MFHVAVSSTQLCSDKNIWLWWCHYVYTSSHCNSRNVLKRITFSLSRLGYRSINLHFRNLFLVASGERRSHCLGVVYTTPSSSSLPLYGESQHFVTICECIDRKLDIYCIFSKTNTSLALTGKSYFINLTTKRTNCSHCKKNCKGTEKWDRK